MGATVKVAGLDRRLHATDTERWAAPNPHVTKPAIPHAISPLRTNLKRTAKEGPDVYQANTHPSSGARIVVSSGAGGLRRTPHPK
jgi:hypothetical protein